MSKLLNRMNQLKIIGRDLWLNSFGGSYWVPKFLRKIRAELQRVRYSATSVYRQLPKQSKQPMRKKSWNAGSPLPKRQRRSLMLLLKRHALR